MKQRRAIIGSVVALLAALLVSAASPAAFADPAKDTGAAQSTHTATVPLTGHPVAAQGGAVPDGKGPPYSFNCGTAQLWVNASTHRYRILLTSTKGTFTSGFYNVTTDGIGDVPWPGRINTGSTTSNNVGSIPVPGVWIRTAYVGGTVFTSQDWVCFFVINAPWD